MYEHKSRRLGWYVWCAVRIKQMNDASDADYFYFGENLCFKYCLDQFHPMHWTELVLYFRFNLSHKHLNKYAWWRKKPPTLCLPALHIYESSILVINVNIKLRERKPQFYQPQVPGPEGWRKMQFVTPSTNNTKYKSDQIQITPNTNHNEYQYH